MSDRGAATSSPPSSRRPAALLAAALIALLTACDPILVYSSIVLPAGAASEETEGAEPVALASSSAERAGRVREPNSAAVFQFTRPAFDPSPANRAAIPTDPRVRFPASRVPLRC